MNPFETIRNIRVVPVVVLSSADAAAPLADALVEGGLPIAEVTFRTDAAEESIRRMAGRDGLLVGAGSVVRPSQVDQAVDAGARFIVSPGTSVAVIKRCQELGVDVLPGAVTATEVMTLLDLGITTMKFFPAGTSGGAKAIAGLSAPFRDAEFIPTGGVGLANLADYLSLPSVPAVGGSWMVPASAIDGGRFDEVARLCGEAVSAARDVQG